MVPSSSHKIVPPKMSGYEWIEPVYSDPDLSATDIAASLVAGPQVLMSQIMFIAKCA